MSLQRLSPRHRIWGAKAYHPIIASIFLQDGRLFLLGFIGANNSSPFPFQVDLKWAHDLLLLVVQIFHPPFEQLLEKRADHF